VANEDADRLLVALAGKPKPVRVLLFSGRPPGAARCLESWRSSGSCGPAGLLIKSGPTPSSAPACSMWKARAAITWRPCRRCVVELRRSNESW